MRRIYNYIYLLEDWPSFKWNYNFISKLLTEVRHKQGRLLGRMDGIGFTLRNEASLNTLTLDVVKSSEIEGELLNSNQVRSSIARRLGIEIAGLVPSDRNVEGVVEMMLDATQNYTEQLNENRLFGWHAALFPTGRSGMYKIVVGDWRKNDANDPMQVVSGPMGKETVHYEAPESERLTVEMKRFIEWFNNEHSIDAVLKAAIAHLWFVTIHPFDDGNGRIARAITDMQLARCDESKQRFYSMSSQIRQQRKGYYEVLEKTQKGDLDITEWLYWFLQCLSTALDNTAETLSIVIHKAKFWEMHSATALNERQKLLINKLQDEFEGKLTSSKWAKIAKCSQDTALRDIQDLLEKKILIKEDAGGRSTSYILISLL